MEEVFGVGPVIDRVVGGAVEEERLVLPAKERGVLPGDDAASAVDELFGEHDRRRKIVAGGDELLGEGRQRRPVGLFRSAGIEAHGDVRSAGEHDVMAGGMVVGRVRQRPYHRPFFAPGREHRQVFTDLEPGRLRGNRLEAAADVERAIGLRIEALVLRQPPGEEDVDHRLRRPHRSLGGRRGRGPRGGECIEGEPEKPQGTSLHGRPAVGDTAQRMVIKVCHRRRLSLPGEQA